MRDLSKNLSTQQKINYKPDSNANKRRPRVDPASHVKHLLLIADNLQINDYGELLTLVNY